MRRIKLNKIKSRTSIVFPRNLRILLLYSWDACYRLNFPCFSPAYRPATIVVQSLSKFRKNRDSYFAHRLDGASPVHWMCSTTRPPALTGDHKTTCNGWVWATTWPLTIIVTFHSSLGCWAVAYGWGNAGRRIIFLAPCPLPLAIKALSDTLHSTWQTDRHPN